MTRPAAEPSASSGTRHAPGDARRALLDKSATAAGTLWAQRWCDELRKEGRPVVGGWPGTLREARAQVSAYLGTSLGKRKLSFTREELERAAKTAYTAAKNSWLAKVDREEDEDADDFEAEG